MLIKTYTKQIKTLEKSIERVLETIPEAQCLLSIPGIARVYTAGIIAEIGQIERFENQAKLFRMPVFTGRKPIRHLYCSKYTHHQIG